MVFNLQSAGLDSVNRFYHTSVWLDVKDIMESDTARTVKVYSAYSRPFHHDNFKEVIFLHGDSMTLLITLGYKKNVWVHMENKSSMAFYDPILRITELPFCHSL